MKFKRALTALTSYVMVASMLLQPVTIYAAGAQQAAQQESTVASETANSSSAASSSDDSATDSQESTETDAAADQAESATEKAAATSQTASAADEAEAVEDTDAIEFLYIDLPSLNEGCEQNIAISLKDEFGTISAAKLTLANAEGTERVLESSASDGNAFLYTTSDLAVGTWTVSKVSVTTDEGDVEVPFTNCDNNSFVVNKSESAEVNSEDLVPVNAYTLNSKGKVEQADSIADAIETAEKATDEAESKSSSSKTSGSTGSIAAAALSTVKNLFKSVKADVTRSSGTVTVAINPGHGGWDTGSTGINGVHEADLNWKIAVYLKQELETYNNVRVVMTKNSQGEVLGSTARDELRARAQRAKNAGADVYVSIHLNASGVNAKGAEVWVPNNSNYSDNTHTVGKALGKQILAQLTALGLGNRGVKTRSYENGYIYNADADGCGKAQDYYGDIRYAREQGIPGIIVEHCFIDNADDYNRYLSSEDKLKQLAVADAKGIAAQYNLKRKGTYVSAQAHVQDYGWQAWSTSLAGTTGQGKRVEALRFALESDKYTGGVEARAYVQNKGWLSWTKAGNVVGTSGQSLRLEALQLKLTGDVANHFDIYYRVHAENFGWLGWTKNGETAGTADYSYRLEAVEWKLVAKGSAGPSSSVSAFKKATQTIQYKAHVQNIGWQNPVTAGDVAGTTGKSYRIEALNFGIIFQKDAGTIKANAHVQNIGWQGWRTGSVGTSGKSLRLEAIQFKLEGAIANKYDIYYRVHAQNFGWMGWAKNGASAGTSGYSYRLEAVQIQLVAKGGNAPGSTANAYREAPEEIQYQAHVQNIGWQGAVTSGGTAGTTGRSLRVEALNLGMKNQKTSGAVKGNAHVQNIGWQGWRSGSIGTSGRGLRLEAIQLKLEGNLASKYDIYYRVHAQNFGWMGWAKNGESAGSEGYSYRLEAIQVKLVAKGGSAPGSTANAFKKYVAPATEKIMGSSKYTAAQMAKLYKSVGKSYPTSTYQSKGAANIESFCTILVDEAKAEGVRAEVVFAQSMIETGWLQYGGSVKASQCNFAGLGATSSTVGGATFKDVRTGLRAQVQHLKAYASTDKLKNACVDPRFSLVKRGCAPLITDLNGKWAVPGTTYGQNIIATMNKLAKF